MSISLFESHPLNPYNMYHTQQLNFALIVKAALVLDSASLCYVLDDMLKVAHTSC